MSASPAIYEGLSKLLAYVDDQPQYQQQVQGLLNTVGYRIDRTFDDPQTGFHALGLVSLTPDKAPVLVFRGTNSIADDPSLTDKNTIGLPQFQANKQAFGDWLNQVSQDTTKNPNRLPPDLTGHSLGGALAQLTAAEFTPIIGDTVTFNSPGISQAIVDAFKQKGGTTKNVTHFIVNGDIVSLAGETFLPGKMILESYTTPILDPVLALDKHNVRNLLTSPPPGFTTQQISVEQFSNPNFTYSDADFNKLKLGLSVALPPIAQALNARGNVEAIRKSDGFSYLGFIQQLRTVLSPTTNQLLVGDNFDDQGSGFAGNDTLFGYGGNDNLNGNVGNDLINGGKGNDILFGGKGDDTLIGGTGNDVLTGGSGKDVFVLASAGNETITDFRQGEDIIGLSGGLTFDQLNITQGNNGAVITAKNAPNTILGTVNGVQSNTLTASDFISFKLP